MDGFSAWHHDEWDERGLADYSDFSDKTTDCNQEEFGDCTRGDWFYISELPLANGNKVIYSGTWGNDNSPGADTYTYATIYGPEDEAEYQADKQRWESAPEWLDVEEEGYDLDYAEDGQVAGEYENGLCPDCNEPIRVDTQYGEACDNCDHVFNKPTPCDDGATE